MMLKEIESKQIPEDLLETGFAFVSWYLQVKDKSSPELSKDKRQHRSHILKGHGLVLVYMRISENSDSNVGIMSRTADTNITQGSETVIKNLVMLSNKKWRKLRSNTN